MVLPVGGSPPECPRPGVNGTLIPFVADEQREPRLSLSTRSL